MLLTFLWQDAGVRLVGAPRLSRYSAIFPDICVWVWPSLPCLKRAKLSVMSSQSRRMSYEEGSSGNAASFVQLAAPVPREGVDDDLGDPFTVPEGVVAG